ncbi:MAG: ROK family protein [Bacteroidales bacterium]|nr:ROK family protein [Bacteroidales bacterium]
MGTGKYRLGLDVGGTSMTAGVIGEDFTVISKANIPSGAGRSIEEITDDMVRCCTMAVGQSGIHMEDIASWGIGMPSCVNPSTRMLVHANCFGWKNVPIYDYLEGRLPLPLKIDNDANCAAFGETLAGAAKGRKNVIMLTLGTGVGGGIVLDGKIYAGADGMGAELGHTKLVYDGELCTCGQKGCLESYCSATALIRHAGEALEKAPGSLIGELCGGDRNVIDARMVFHAAAGDQVATDLVEDYISRLASGLSTFITIFRPESIILGGGVSNAGDQLFVPLNQKLAESTFGAEQIGVPEVIPAILGTDAGLVGAAFL